jgi:nitroreductase
MHNYEDTFELIRTRRSIRKYTAEDVSSEVIDRIIEAGMWAPSGLNNQPWKFAVIKDRDIKASIAELTHYSRIVSEANTLIAVLLDSTATYDRTKDCQSVGACIQNMLLFIHSLGLGAVWLGQILKNKEKVVEVLGLGRELELMAVIALGHSDEQGGNPSRKSLDQTVIFRR